MNVLTGGGSGGFENTLLFIIGFVILFNAIFLPTTQEETWDNIPHLHDISVAMDQTVVPPQFIRQQYRSPFLIGFIMVFTQAGRFPAEVVRQRFYLQLVRC